MLIVFGMLRRAIVLGAKFDECPQCGTPGPHLLLRRTAWFTLFWLPVVLLGIGHSVLCPACGYRQDIGFRQMRRALKEGRLPLGRSRPRFETLVREHLFGVTEADWRAFGLEPDSSVEQLHSRWRTLAKKLHPDAGGDAATFVTMQALYQRLLAARSTSVVSAPDPADIFDPIIPNPKRGPWDFYTKAWGVLVVAVLVLAGISSAIAPKSTASASSGYNPPGAPAPGVAGAAHVCFASGNSLTGCEGANGLMLFGTAAEMQITCYFDAVPAPGEYVDCRR